MGTRPELRPDAFQLLMEGPEVDEALRKAGREAIRVHRQAGVPLAIWRDGQVVLVSADELERELGPEPEPPTPSPPPR